MDRHLVILVKAPRIGTVKTRLAAGIGLFAAWQFYRRTTANVLRRLTAKPQPSGWRVWLAVTPDSFAGSNRFWPADIRQMPQGRGDLGRRMARPLRTLPRGPVVVIGSDIPDITQRHIHRAFEALRRSDVVVGPAEDGGYWLIGMRRRPIPVGQLRPSLLTDVRWSSSDALADTLKGLDARLSVNRIDTLNDIDTPEDLQAWLRKK